MFAYCGNNPVMHIDPSGCFTLVEIILVLIVIGIIGLSIGPSVKRITERSKKLNSQNVLNVNTEDEFLASIDERAKIDAENISDIPNEIQHAEDIGNLITSSISPPTTMIGFIESHVPLKMDLAYQQYLRGTMNGVLNNIDVTIINRSEEDIRLASYNFLGKDYPDHDYNKYYTYYLERLYYHQHGGE